MRRARAQAEGERISVISEGVKLPLSKQKIKKTVTKILTLLKEKDSKVSILFVDDKGIRRLNRKYRRIDRPTDCLAFPMREGKYARMNPQLLGDVVISVDTAGKNAKSFGTDVEDEVSLYIVHGILHLLGFNDATERKRSKMRILEEKILSRL